MTAQATGATMTGADQIDSFDGIDLDQVMQRTTLGTTTIYKLMEEGTFPPNFQLTGKRKVWLSADIDQWLHWRIASSRGLQKWTPPTE